MLRGHLSLLCSRVKYLLMLLQVNGYIQIYTHLEGGGGGGKHKGNRRQRGRCRPLSERNGNVMGPL